MSAGDSIVPSAKKPKVALLYHYMYPDDVVSAVLFDSLGQSLAARGWDVEAQPSNRGCRDETKSYTSTEVHKGVFYNRVWRPGFRQSKTVGRLLNSFWMIVAWLRLSFRRRTSLPDVVVIGSDPVFAILTAVPLRLLRPSLKIVHWCHDLHPEAGEAAGLASKRSIAVRVLKKIMARAYGSCDLIVDLGLCMRKRLRLYDHGKPELELTPWALVEPSELPVPDPATRRDLFGEAKLGILYSGNFGEAHTADLFLQLARKLRGNADIHFCFAIRGNHAEKVKAAVTPEDTNISFPGFAPIKEFEKRLAAADIHLVSLKPEWEGIAVPSKFFGSIAMGRPVIYDGPAASAIGTWIKEYECGLTLNLSNIDNVAQKLAQMAVDRSGLKTLQNSAFQAYASHFSSNAVLNKWDEALTKLLPSARQTNIEHIKTGSK